MSNTYLDPGLGRKVGVNGILGITGEFDYGVSMVMLSDRCFFWRGNGTLISFPLDLQLEILTFRVVVLKLWV